MMIELQKYLKNDFITYFDWIAGTSTGSMIACLLCYNKSLTELRKNYFIFKDKIFKGNRPYNHETLEMIFKTYLHANDPFKKIFETLKKHLIVTSCRVDCFPPILELFCSHDEQLDDQLLIWQTLRASCAAPTYFHNYYSFIDGGLIANNPTMDAITEYFRYHECLKERTSNYAVPKLELVLSFGTGKAKTETKNYSPVFNKFNNFLDLWSFARDINNWIFGSELVTQTKLQVTNCNDHIVLRAASWCHSIDTLFFRINAPFNKKIPLDEFRDDELIDALWEVKLYCYQMSNYFKNIAKLMDNSG